MMIAVVAYLAIVAMAIVFLLVLIVERSRRNKEIELRLIELMARDQAENVSPDTDKWISTIEKEQGHSRKVILPVARRVMRDLAAFEAMMKG